MVNDRSVVLCETGAGGSLRCVNMEASPLATATDRLSEICIERDDHEVVDERIVDDDGIVLICEASVTSSRDSVAAALEQKGHWLDHVLVGEER